MSKVYYYLVLKPVSYLPFSFLYLISDLLFILVYRMAGYRKSVVFNNLRNSFPEKNKEEIITIQSAFYRHLCDVIVESIKLFSISEQELRQRFRITNESILDEMHEQGRSIILVGGHYNNWEIAAKGFDLNSRHQAVGIYSPLRDKFFEKKLNESRTEFGVEIVAKAFVPRAFVANKDRITMTIFGADQSPTYSKGVHWMNFLNQETAVHTGTEVFAAKYNYPVVFIRIDKVKRGFYEGKLEILSENPGGSKKGEITELHTRYLEKIIREKPEYWLWSHKRWKRKMTDEERIQFEGKISKISPAA
jgi:KDO2-lipid IV(A) lauroyltransferase